MDDNFFKEPNKNMEEQNQEQVIEKVKVGEEEYTQEELSKLVGLGKIGQEAESKYNVTLDKVWQNHQSTINDKKALEEELKTYKDKEIQAAKSKEEVSQEEAEKMALEQAEKLGLMTKKSVDQYIAQVFSARDLINQTQSAISKHVSEGKPDITTDDLLAYMDEQGIKNPDAAYKLKFEPEIEKIKEAKLSTIKQNGVVTNQTSTAGAKVPEPVKITRDNLNALLAERVKVAEQL